MNEKMELVWMRRHGHHNEHARCSRLRPLSHYGPVRLPSSLYGYGRELRFHVVTLLAACGVSAGVCIISHTVSCILSTRWFTRAQCTSEWASRSAGRSIAFMKPRNYMMARRGNANQNQIFSRGEGRVSRGL